MSPEALGYAVETFDKLYTAQGAHMAMTIRWAIGGGYILITKDEWMLQPDSDAKAALVKGRAEVLYQRLLKGPNQ
jgi:hypothetical protein